MNEPHPKVFNKLGYFQFREIQSYREKARTHERTHERWQAGRQAHTGETPTTQLRNMSCCFFYDELFFSILLYLTDHLLFQNQIKHYNFNDSSSIFIIAKIVIL